jgi:hypothetical protein
MGIPRARSQAAHTGVPAALNAARYPDAIAEIPKKSATSAARRVASSPVAGIPVIGAGVLVIGSVMEVPR